jgi:hypothetical protein
MNQEEPFLVEHGDKPSCTITWEWGRDELNGDRLDRYSGADGFLYERMTPSGGGYCPEIAGQCAGARTRLDAHWTYTKQINAVLGHQPRWTWHRLWRINVFRAQFDSSAQSAPSERSQIQFEQVMDERSEGGSVADRQSNSLRP